MIRREQRLHQLMVAWRCIKAQGCMESIIQQCEQTNGTREFGLLSMTVYVDLMCLAEMDSDVANFIVRKPLEGTMLFREVVREVLVVKGVLADITDLSQLAVSMRITCATLPDFRWASGHRAKYQGLQKLRGIIIGLTAAISYTKSTKYTCPKEECEGHYGNQYVRIHVPGASEQETVGRKFTCCVCGSNLKEVKSQRSLSDKLLAEVVPSNSVGQRDVHHQCGDRQQAVAVIIRDDLCGRAELGHDYEMIGTQRVSFDADSVTRIFEVNNLILEPNLFQVGNSNRSRCFRLPFRVQLLFSKWKDVPYVFPHLMAYSFADHVCPPNSFFKLKLLLLISLVLTPETTPLHVLAVCSETHLVQRLMDWAAILAPRDVPHVSSLHVLGAKTSTSRYPWAPYFLQALTESRVQVALEARCTGSLPGVMSLPLSCHVWALISTVSNTHNSTSVGTTTFSYGATGTTSDIPTAMLDAFSLVYQCDVNLSSSTDVTEDLASHILLSNMTSEENTVRNMGQQSDCLMFDDFTQYVQAARSLTSVMTVEAEYLLTSYLIGARHARAHTTQASHGSAVPLTAWNTLQAMSHGLCRLSLRSAVMESDALMAIALYEETLSARHGVSALNIFPEPHLPAQTAETYITTQLLPEMHKFHSRLLSFCANAGTGPAIEE